MVKLSGYLLRPCKSSAAFEAIPNLSSMGKQKQKFKLDLTECRNILETSGYEEVCNAKVLLIMKNEIEVTIYPSGKLIIKTDSKSDAEKVMNEIYDRILITD